MANTAAMTSRRGRSTSSDTAARSTRWPFERRNSTESKMNFNGHGDSRAVTTSPIIADTATMACHR